MRLLINTNDTQFRVAGPAKAKQDYKDKERQATTRDGEPIWTVRLDAIEPEREARETIWVEVAGDQPRLTFDGTCRCATSYAADRSRESDYQIKWPHEDNDRNRGITALLRPARCRRAR
jgi:hypothetical protein